MAPKTKAVMTEDESRRDTALRARRSAAMQEAFRQKAVSRGRTPFIRELVMFEQRCRAKYEKLISRRNHFDARSIEWASLHQRAEGIFEVVSELTEIRNSFKEQADGGERNDA